MQTSCEVLTLILLTANRNTSKTLGDEMSQNDFKRDNSKQRLPHDYTNLLFLKLNGSMFHGGVTEESPMHFYGVN